MTPTPEASQVAEAVKTGEQLKHILDTMFWKGIKDHPEKAILVDGLEDLLSLARLYLEAVKDGRVPREIHQDFSFLGGSEKDIAYAQGEEDGLNKMRSQFIPLLMAERAKNEELKKRTIFFGAAEEFIGFTISEQKLLDEIKQLQSQLASAQERIAKLEAIAERVRDEEGIVEHLDLLYHNDKLSPKFNYSDLQNIAQALSKWLEEGK